MPGSFSLRKLSLQKLRKGSNTDLASENINHRESSNNLLIDAVTSPQTLQIGAHAEGPISNVWRFLNANLDKHVVAPMLYCEMLYLQMGHQQTNTIDEDELSPSFKQKARWIHYEQTVDGEGTRFSKPHVTFLNLQSLLQLRNSLRRGLVLLDQTFESTGHLFESIQRAWMDKGLLTEDRDSFVKMILTSPKLHLVHGRLRRADELVSDKHHHHYPLNLHGASNDDLKSDLQPSEESSSTTLECKMKTKIETNDRLDACDNIHDKPDEHLLKKLAPGTESAAILVADVYGGITQPLTAFVRLKEGQMFYPDLPDHSIPIRFLFILLNDASCSTNDETLNLGRTMGALFSDEVFQKIAYNCDEKSMLADSIDEFIAQSVMIPPGKTTMSARCRPEDLAVENTAEITKKRIGLLSEDQQQSTEHSSEIAVSGRLFGGLRDDIRRKLPFFMSDFTDFFKGRITQSVSAVVFMFFANLTNILAFGALMHKMFDGQVSAIENIVCAALSGIVFGLFSGQPLNILSATGPTLIFEKIIYDICVQQGWSFLTFRFWMGIWIFVLLVGVIVAKDLSAMVGFITRFTEDAFATLVSVVFVIQAVEKIWEIRTVAPLTLEPEKLLSDPSCYCVANGSKALLNPSNLQFGANHCQQFNGTLLGEACLFRPDVFLFSIILSIGTFALAMYLHSFKQSPYLTSKIRNFVSDFGVLISIVIFTALANLVNIRVDKLQVPDTLSPTMNRSWIIDIWDTTVYSALIAIIPALLYTILIVMDQQITAVIVNRKDNKLKKGSGYHLDLFIIGVLVLICSLVGLPFYVAATVLSIAHLDALKIQSDVSVPGETPTFYGIKEQRLTVILSHLLIGLSLFLARFVRLIPVAVLIGIFLYMGVVSLNGQQFIQRLKLFLMPTKYQPDYKWLRSVKMKRVHVFTTIQLISILALFGLKSLSSVKILFPLLLVVMVIIRAVLLERIFTQSELLALDDRLLGWKEIMQPTKKSKQKDFNLSRSDLEAAKHVEKVPFTIENNNNI